MSTTHPRRSSPRVSPKLAVLTCCCVLFGVGCSLAPVSDDGSGDESSTTDAGDGDGDGDTTGAPVEFFADCPAEWEAQLYPVPVGPPCELFQPSFVTLPPASAEALGWEKLEDEPLCGWWGGMKYEDVPLCFQGRCTEPLMCSECPLKTLAVHGGQLLLGGYEPYEAGSSDLVVAFDMDSQSFARLRTDRELDGGVVRPFPSDATWAWPSDAKPPANACFVAMSWGKETEESQSYLAGHIEVSTGSGVQGPPGAGNYFPLAASQSIVVRRQAVEDTTDVLIELCFVDQNRKQAVVLSSTLYPETDKVSDSLSRDESVIFDGMTAYDLATGQNSQLVAESPDTPYPDRLFLSGSPSSGRFCGSFYDQVDSDGDFLWGGGVRCIDAASGAVTLEFGPEGPGLPPLNEWDAGRYLGVHGGRLIALWEIGLEPTSTQEEGPHATKVRQVVYAIDPVSLEVEWLFDATTPNYKDPLPGDPGPARFEFMNGELLVFRPSNDRCIERLPLD